MTKCSALLTVNVVAQSCLCSPMDYSPPDSSVHGISQARILGSIQGSGQPFSRDLPNPWIESRSSELQENSLLSEPPGKPFTGSKSCQSHSCVQLVATPQTVAHQAPLSMEFSRQEYGCGLPFPSPEDLPNPGIKPGSPALQADSLPSEPLGKPQTLSHVHTFTHNCQMHKIQYIHNFFSLEFYLPLKKSVVSLALCDSQHLIECINKTLRSGNLSHLSSSTCNPRHLQKCLGIAQLILVE